MMVHRCDNCRKIIEKSEQVIVGRDIFTSKVELCPKCARPIMDSVEESALAARIKQKLKEKSKF